MSKSETIMIDYVKYVRADSISTSSHNVDGMDYCIVRSRDQGVMCGYVESIDGLLDENKHLRSALTDFKSALLECGRERERLREALEEIATSDPPKGVYGEGIYWWCVEIAKKALGA